MIGREIDLSTDKSIFVLFLPAFPLKYFYLKTYTNHYSTNSETKIQQIEVDWETPILKSYPKAPRTYVAHSVKSKDNKSNSK